MNANAPQSSGTPAYNLAGKTALITGGSRGIGRAIGARFMQAGGSVILLARRPDVLAETKAELDPISPGKVSVIPCDVANVSDIAAMWEKVSAEKRRIDILVNNAGTATRGEFEKVPDEMWMSDFNQKLFACIRLSRLVIPGMKARKWGRIINVLSINGKTPTAGNTPTDVTRAAGLALTKLLASEFAPHNILVNALCTGLILTDQTHRRHARNAADLTFEEYLKIEAKPIPLGRVGAAEEYADVALFLASDFSSYVTGTSINIDGGLCKVL